ncbi:hypothetical protein KJ975_11755 [Myxococcota bacterium]|nr:hypothetical protein [Myxococcota bacterium]
MMQPDIMGWVLGGVLGVLFIVIETFMIGRLLRVPLPHRFLVVTGGRHNRGGKTLGFRIARKLTYVIPVVEQCREIDGSCIPCRIEVRNAYLPGGVRVKASLFALVRLSTDPALAACWIERFLDRPTGDIAQVSTETMEGAARQVLSTLAAEEVGDLTFLAGMADATAESFRKLGLELVHLSVSSLRMEA